MTRNPKTGKEEIQTHYVYGADPCLQQHSRPPTTGRTTSHQEVSKEIEIKMSDSRSKMGTSSYKEISSAKSKSQPARRMERAMATQAETLEWHKKRWGQHSFNLLLCPAFSSLAVTEDGFYEWVFHSESFTEEYVLLIFLPMDGNVDKAELEAFSAEVYQLASLSCQVGNLNQTNIDHSKRWLPSRGTVWPPFARLTTI